MRIPTTILALLAGLALALAGCGGDDETPGSREDPDLSVVGVNIPASDLDRVKEAEKTIRVACGGDREPGAGAPRDTLDEAVQHLVDITQRIPEGIYAPNSSTRQRNMQTVARENADRLAGCGQEDAAARLREAASTGG